MGKGAGKGGDATVATKNAAARTPDASAGKELEKAAVLKQRLGKPLWTLYGQTIDLEEFAKVHPGGELHLRLGQGLGDCTKLYESYHVRNANHHAVLKKWGVTAPVAPSAFHEDLKLMVQAYEKKVGTIKATWGHWALLFSFAVALAVCVAGWLQGNVWAMLCLPLAHWMLFINSSHDGSHSAMSHKPWVNNVMCWTACPLVYLPTTWYGQHVVSHHTHTNEEGLDLDLHHFHGTKVGRIFCPPLLLCARAVADESAD